MTDLMRFRQEFPITERVAFLDNAAVAPVSLRVKQRTDAYLDDALHVARPAAPKWFAEIERTRGLASRILGCEAEEVAFAQATSGALSLVAESIPWRPLENVVTAANEFPSNMYPWMNLSRKGVRVKAVRPTHQGRVTVDELVAAIDRHTRVVSISWVGFNSGYRIDLARLGAECAKRGVYLVVDMIQGLGALEFEAREWGVTAAAADAHKWLLGPEGTAVLYVSKDAVGSLYPPVAGWKTVVNRTHFMHYDWRPVETAARFEPGSFNTAGIYGLAGALELFLEVGMDRVTARVKELTDYLIAGLAKKGIDPLSPRGPGEWSGIVSFPAPGGDGPAVQKALEARGVICTGRADFMRVSPHFYNAESDIDRLLAAL